MGEDVAKVRAGHDRARADLIEKLQEDESLEDDRIHLNLIRRFKVFFLEIEGVISPKLEIEDILALEQKDEVD